MEITRKQKCEEKQPSGRFKRPTSYILREKTWMWLWKGNSKRENESLLIAAQNNTVRTSIIKARLEKSQQKSKCRFWGDRDETINHILSECSKLVQKEYKTRHDWVGKGSPGNCARYLNVTIRPNGICTTQHLSGKMRGTNSSGILWYKQITKSRPEDQTL